MTMRMILNRSVPALCISALGGLALFGLGCSSVPVNVPATEVTENVSFSQQIQPIFNQFCIECHVTGGFALGFVTLRLTDGDSYGLLVSQTSSQDASSTLVVAGDSASSLLFQKVSQDSPPVGVRMPFSPFYSPRAPLSSQDLGLIRDWIDQGAADN